MHIASLRHKDVIDPRGRGNSNPTSFLPWTFYWWINSRRSMDWVFRAAVVFSGPLKDCRTATLGEWFSTIKWVLILCLALKYAAVSIVSVCACGYSTIRFFPHYNFAPTFSVFLIGTRLLQCTQSGHWIVVTERNPPRNAFLRYSAHCCDINMYSLIGWRLVSLSQFLTF